MIRRKAIVSKLYAKTQSKERVMRNTIAAWMFSIGIALMSYSVVLQQRCTYQQARARINVLIKRMAAVQNLQDEGALLKAVWAAKLRGECL